MEEIGLVPHKRNGAQRILKKKSSVRDPIFLRGVLYGLQFCLTRFLAFYNLIYRKFAPETPASLFASFTSQLVHALRFWDF
jgi:hypothetical protein